MVLEVKFGSTFSPPRNSKLWMQRWPLPPISHELPAWHWISMVVICMGYPLSYWCHKEARQQFSYDPPEQMALFNEVFPGKVNTSSWTPFFKQSHDLCARCNGALAQSFVKIHPRLSHFTGDLIEKGRGIEQHRWTLLWSCLMTPSWRQFTEWLKQKHLTSVLQLTGNICTALSALHPDKKTCSWLAFRGPTKQKDVI